MRLILFFDLPTTTKQDLKIYSSFRKYLIQNGYIMIQYSVYARIFNNRDAVKDHIQMLHKKTPQKGHIRVMTVTEKQYSKTLIILGGKSNQEKILTVNPFVHL